MPGSPYTDLDRPPLDARRLQRALIVPDGLWSRLVLRTETGSTNADVADAARAGEPEGLVVVAERQTAGRGRRGRSWESPARAGIAVSVLLRPGLAAPARGWSAVSPARYGWLPLLAGVALVEAVDRLAELDSALKWPNDLLVWPGVGSQVGAPGAAAAAGAAGLGSPVGGSGAAAAGVAGVGSPVGGPGGAGPVPVEPAGEPSGEAKCAGILAEGVAAGAGVPPAVVVGIGLNVTLRTDELPVTTGLPATSLQLAGAVATDRDPLLRALLRGVERWYGRWRAAGGDAEQSGLREAYLRHCATLGREVRVLLPGGDDLVGAARTIDLDGQLVLDTVDGERRVAAGDVLHLR